jgi:hypothetical protein
LFENHRPLTYLLRHTSGWKVDYEDKTAVLFERLRPLAPAQFPAKTIVPPSHREMAAR